MGSYKRILIVEDDEQDVSMIKEALADIIKDDKIDIAVNGKEGLDYLLQRGKFANRENLYPAAILLDLKMPKMNGLEFLKMMRKHKELRRIPIIVFTSSNIEEDIHFSYQYGANAYVQKPIEFEKFNQAVKNIGTFWLKRNISLVI